MSLRNDLPAIWYGRRRVPLLLSALVPIYRVLRWIHRSLYRFGLRQRIRLPVPVVVVGNLTAGGTGKTPLVIALVRELRARGFTPAVITRGYRAAGSVAQVDIDSDPVHVGDEPYLIFQSTGAAVGVGRDRISAARLVLADPMVDVLVADDGLQHYRLQRDVEICVIDGALRFGNGQLLPAGPLREPLERLRTVDFCVCNGGTPAGNEIAMTLRGSGALFLREPDKHAPLQSFRGSQVHAIAGIGNPARFFASLRDAGLDVIEHAFADHHPFVDSEIAFADGLPVLMTAKDAVKCRAFADDSHWFVPVSAHLPSEFFDAIVARIRGTK